MTTSSRRKIPIRQYGVLVTAMIGLFAVAIMSLLSQNASMAPASNASIAAAAAPTTVERSVTHAAQQTVLAPTDLVSIDPAPTTSYTVKRGDTLIGVFGANWQPVYNKNKALIGPNPGMIRPGQVLDTTGISRKTPASPVELTAHTTALAPAPAAAPAPAPAAPAATSVAQRAVAFAMSKLGAPYSWGAAGPGAFDCSGLVFWAYKQAGKTLGSRITSGMASLGTAVTPDVDHLIPGDIVLYYAQITHVSMYIGDGKVIYAPQTGEVVKIGNLNYGPIYNARRVA